MTNAKVQPPVHRTATLQIERGNETAEDIASRVSANLALLIRLAVAEGNAPRENLGEDLESYAGSAIERLLLDARKDVERLAEIAQPSATKGGQ